MHEVWERRRDEARVVVRPEDAVYTLEQEFGLPQAILWDYLTKPEYWAVVYGSESGKVTTRAERRVGKGAVYYCAHGKSAYPQTVVDWHPFDQITIETKSYGATELCTLTLIPTERGTMARFAVGASKGPPVWRTIHQVVGRLIGPWTMRDGCSELQRLLEERVASGALVKPTPGEVSTTDIDNAVTDSLTPEANSSV